MSIYRCCECGCIRDADEDGINEHPNEEFGEICDECEQNLDEEEVK